MDPVSSSSGPMRHPSALCSISGTNLRHRRGRFSRFATNDLKGLYWESSLAGSIRPVVRHLPSKET